MFLAGVIVVAIAIATATAIHTGDDFHLNVNALVFDALVLYLVAERLVCVRNSLPMIMVGGAFRIWFSGCCCRLLVCAT